MIQFRCPQCQALLKVPGDKAGRTGKCPKCQTQVTAPALQAQGPDITTWKEDTQPVRSLSPAAAPSSKYSAGSSGPPSRSPHTPRYRYAKVLGTSFVVLGWIISGLGVVALISTMAGPDNWNMPAAFLLVQLPIALGVVVGGLFSMAFGQLRHCIHDMAQNSFHLRE